MCGAAKKEKIFKKILKTSKTKQNSQNGAATLGESGGFLVVLLSYDPGIVLLVFTEGVDNYVKKTLPMDVYGNLFITTKS